MTIMAFLGLKSGVGASVFPAALTAPHRNEDRDISYCHDLRNTDLLIRAGEE